MCGGGFIALGAPGNYDGNITAFVLVACMVAATGGLIFGYDLGISGGVTSMEEFLEKFFPSVYYKMNDDDTGHTNEYCKFDSQLLTLFTSSLYVAALVASFFASATTRAFGRKTSMCFAGIVFLFGSILNGAAINLEMLIIGRLLLGVGVGFANQSVPVYLSEMAPANLRGALNIGFQMAITIGILVANLVNYGTAKLEGGYGWRVSLALAAVPGVMMTVGSLCLPDTPNSLIERGHRDEAKQMLQKLRGTNNVDDEFQDLIVASETSKQVEHPWKNILQPSYRPQFVIALLIPFFQQLTGINVIMFYAPVLFKTLGFGDDAALMSAVITGLVNVFATLVSIFSVDRSGRRVLFLAGGIQMIVCQMSAMFIKISWPAWDQRETETPNTTKGVHICLILVGIILGMNFGVTGEGSLSKGNADLVLFLICFYVIAFAWSWGPLGWLVPSEIFPLEIRSAGQAINVSVNMFFTFIIAQVFLSMLCHMKFGIFFFFAGFGVIMTLFIYFFLPETKGIPIEEIYGVWKAHWFWGKYMHPDLGKRGQGGGLGCKSGINS